MARKKYAPPGESSSSVSLMERLAILYDSCPIRRLRCCRKRTKVDGNATDEVKKPMAPAWSSSVCGCTDDIGTCAIVCFCPFAVVPQLYEREVGPPGVCKKWFIRISALCCVSALVATVRNVYMTFSYGWSCGQYNEYGQNCNWENYPYFIELTFGFVSLLIICTIWAILTTLLKRVRSKVRRKDNIPARLPRCAQAEDCAYSCCCLWCVQCQLLRHLGLTWGKPLLRRRRDKRAGRYTLVSPTGERPAVVAAEDMYDEETASRAMANQKRQARAAEAVVAVGASADEAEEEEFDAHAAAEPDCDSPAPARLLAQPSPDVQVLRLEETRTTALGSV